MDLSLAIWRVVLLEALAAAGNVMVPVRAINEADATSADFMPFFMVAPLVRCSSKLLYVDIRGVLHQPIPVSRISTRITFRVFVFPLNESYLTRRYSLPVPSRSRPFTPCLPMQLRLDVLSLARLKGRRQGTLEWAEPGMTTAGGATVPECQALGVRPWCQALEQLRPQAGHRLVEQQKPGPLAKGEGERHLAPFASGELSRWFVEREAQTAEALAGKSVIPSGV